MTLKGQLRHFGLGEVFQALALAQHTGSLVVQRGEETKTICFATGSIALFSSGKSIRVGEILVREGKVTEEQVRAAADEQQVSGQLLGTILVEKGYVTKDDVQNALRKKIEEEIYDLFLWEDGSFEFLPNHTPPELLDPLHRHTQLNIDPKSILMEGLRQLDEWKLIQNLIPDPRAFVRRQQASLPADAQLEENERKLWERIPETASAGEILSLSPDTRSKTLKHLYRFIERGWLRVLEVDEYLGLARQYRKGARQDQAVSIYLYLYERSPQAKADVQFLLECGSFLLGTTEKKRGGDVLMQAVDLFVRNGEDAAAWEAGMRVYEAGTPTLELLRTLWKLRRAGAPKVAQKIRDTLLERLMKQGKFGEVEDLMILAPEEFAEPRFMILRADARRQAGKGDEAIPLLEKAAAMLAAQNEIDEQIRCAEMILEIDPNRADARHRVQSLRAIQSELERRRKRRFTISGAVLIAGLLASILPIRYELRARESFQRACTLEAAYAQDDLNYDKVIRAYEEVSKGFPYSTMASDASEEVRRLEALKTAHVERVEAVEQAQLQAERDERRRNEEACAALLAQAEAALAAGDHPRARAHCATLLRDYAKLPYLQIRLPLVIQSVPPGAKVRVNGQVAGVTPCLHRYAPGKELEIVLEMPGFRAATVTLAKESTVEVTVERKLDRESLDDGQLPAPFDGRVLAIGDSLFVPCRDGYLYAFAPDFLATQKARWRRRVGLEGHGSAGLCPLGGRIVAASRAGQLLLLRPEDGEAVWALSEESPFTTLPAASADGGWVAVGTEAGSAVLVDATTGGRQVVALSEFPIETVGFDGDTLVTVDRARCRRVRSLPRLEPLAESWLASPAAAALSGGGILLENGLIVERSGTRQLPAVSTAVRVSDAGAAYGSRNGQWVLLEGTVVRAGNLPFAPGSAPFSHGSSLLVGDCTDQLYCVDPSGDVRWSMTVQGRVRDCCAAPGGNAFVISSTGRVVLVEREAP